MIKLLWIINKLHMVEFVFLSRGNYFFRVSKAGRVGRRAAAHATPIENGD